MRKPYMIITGFGPFNGMIDNPTTHLLNWMSSMKAPLTQNYLILGTSTLTVSAQDVQEWLSTTLPGLLQGISEDGDDPLLLVHFGVGAPSQRCFKLECNAYNTANFRVQDERGWAPQNERIDKSLPLNASIGTNMPLQDVLKDLRQQGFDVELSVDPGRFVCNYLYWSSLSASLARRASSCVFIHVPTAEACSEEQLQKFAMCALESIAATCSAK
ncbi:hypothetical protein CEUSTIGMA_g4169.t1 [Chlamydomonas eustigma]|uniref:Pyroglutamyl-peptidase I n=1 Tax=Chlamydomonas eustigma TaxID=1157962 RepID=A0A250X1F7_9CHLO|nr:hypothetical protein CEUSTIGMA_g4169.t1 [Chlamydomonas eustigma]|eukprot:GAX76722.1 hypothetical protein CEUSTIGMA_g4169.t1 [Chlamydomonas eustigma]